LLGAQGRHGVLQPGVPAAAHDDRGVEGEVRARGRGAADGGAPGGGPGGGGASGRRGLRQARRDARRGLMRRPAGRREHAGWRATHALLLPVYPHKPMPAAWWAPPSPAM